VKPLITTVALIVAHAVPPLRGNMLNVSHAGIGRVVAISDAGFGLAFTYGRRMPFAGELPPPSIPNKGIHRSMVTGAVY
jgi:hypothetical protein